MGKAKRAACVGKECVACGCCVKVCPRGAIQVYLGVTARVDSEKCIGCGKCEKVCPAAIITISEREAAI
jgi:ferredoxin